MDVTTTLVLGGTGKTGRRVVDRLRARGRSVRVGSRAGQPPFDWTNHSLWAAALQDVHSVYISYFPDLAASDAEGRIQSLAEHAVVHGAWTILRSSWFAQNFSENFVLDAVRAGHVALPVP